MVVRDHLPSPLPLLPLYYQLQPNQRERGFLVDEMVDEMVKYFISSTILLGR